LQVYSCKNEDIMDKSDESETCKLSPISTIKTETSPKDSDEDMMSLKLMTSHERETNSNLYTNIQPPKKFASQNKNTLGRNSCLSCAMICFYTVQPYTVYNSQLYKPPMKFDEPQESVITSQCTKECKIYGHSDSCWLPRNKNASEFKRNMFYRQQIPEGSAINSEPKTVIFDDIQPLNLKSNLYYNPHRESMYNYDVTNSTSIGKISTPSESSFPQSSKSSESFPSESYMSTKLSNYESNITSPR